MTHSTEIRSRKKMLALKQFMEEHGRTPSQKAPKHPNERALGSLYHNTRYRYRLGDPEGSYVVKAAMEVFPELLEDLIEHPAPTIQPEGPTMSSHNLEQRIEATIEKLKDLSGDLECVAKEIATGEYGKGEEIQVMMDMRRELANLGLYDVLQNPGGDGTVVKLLRLSAKLKLAANVLESTIRFNPNEPEVG